MKKHPERTFYTVALLLIAVAALIPLLWAAMLSFKTNSEIVNAPLALPEAFSFDNYQRALQVLDLGSMYKNTLILVVTGTFFSVVFTFMSAFAITRLHYRHPSVPENLYLFLLIGLAVPVYILLFPIYRIDSRLGILGTRLGLILPYIAVNISFNTLLFVGFLRDFPTEVEEAAIIDGCGIFQLCTRIIMPIMKPIIVTVVLFNAIYIFNEYPFASTFITDTSMSTLSMMTGMFKSQYTMDYSGVIAASFMIMIPELIFYAIFQKAIIGGMTDGAVKG